MTPTDESPTIPRALEYLRQFRRGIFLNPVNDSGELRLPVVRFAAARHATIFTEYMDCLRKGAVPGAIHPVYIGDEMPLIVHCFVLRSDSDEAKCKLLYQATVVSLAMVFGLRQNAKKPNQPVYMPTAFGCYPGEGGNWDIVKTLAEEIFPKVVYARTFETN